jgi:hypothetical protein
VPLEVLPLEGVPVALPALAPLELLPLVLPLLPEPTAEPELCSGLLDPQAASPMVRNGTAIRELIALCIGVLSKEPTRTDSRMGLHNMRP